MCAESTISRYKSRRRHERGTGGKCRPIRKVCPSFRHDRNDRVLKPHHERSDWWGATPRTCGLTRAFFHLLPLISLAKNGTLTIGGKHATNRKDKNMKTAMVVV